MAIYGPYLARVIKFHDGDTIHFDIDLGFDHMIMGQDWKGKPRLSCRVFGINAPELITKAGKVSLAFAQTLLKPGDICKVSSHGWDKYGGRFDGTVIMPDGRDFAKVMLAAGQAVAMKSKAVKTTRAASRED